MNRFNNIIKATAILVLSGFVSCVEVEEQGSAVGYLVSPALDVDVTVDDPARTKAIDFEIEAPSVSDVHFVVKDKDGNVKYSGEGLWSEPLVMPVGAYTVEASAGENGFGKPYFTGSASGSISPLGNEVPALSLALGNALVNVTVHSDFAQHFTGEKVIVGAGALEANFGEWFYVPSGSSLALTLSGKNSAGKDVTFAYSLGAPAAKTAYSVVCKATSNNWPSIEWTATPLSDGAFEGGLYFRPVVVSNMSDINAAAVAYQIKGGDYSDWTDVTVSDVEGYRYISGLANGTEYKLRAYVGNIFSAEQSFVPVTYASCLATDVTAAHNNAGNPSAMLESTAVKAAVSASLPAIVAELATSHTASVSFGNGRVNQTTLGVNAAKQTLANADGWPYLPQGSYPYTATATLTLPGDRTLTAPLSGSVTVPAPEFSLTLSAYTSYDKYAGTNGNAKNVSAANSVPDAATMYDISGGARIAVSLLDNTNYGEKDFKFTMYHYDTKVTDHLSSLKAASGFGVNVVTIGNKSGLSWAQHDLTVSMTFDGVTVTKTNQHHITGLPYSYNFVDGSLDQYQKDGWTLNGKLRSSNIALSGRASTLVLQHQSAFGANKQNGFVVSPRFYAPNQISVEPSIHRSTYTSSGNKERTGYIGVVSNTTTSNTTSITYKTKGGNNTKGTVYGKDEWIDEELNLTSSAPYISIDSDDWTSGGLDAVYYFLHEVHLRYAE